MAIDPVRLLAALCVAAAATIVTLAATAPERAADESVLRVGLLAEVETLDPHTTTSLNDFRVLSNVYEGLVKFAPSELRIVPSLAERWERTDRSLTFHLRDGVLFHDGSAFDAEAVRFNFDRLRDGNHPFAHTGPFPLAFFFEKIAAIEVLDSRRVRFSLSEPFAPLLSNLAYPTGYIVSPAAVRAHGTGFGREGGGTGPYRLERWEPERVLLLERNPYYWGPAPRSAQLAFRPLSDGMTALAELAAGDLDVLTEVGPSAIARFRADGRYRVEEAVGPHLWFLILNTRSPLLRDVRVRQALNLAVDRQRLVRHVLQDTAEVATSVMAGAFDWARAKDLRPYPHDPAAARRLLAEAGVKPNTRLSLLTPKSGAGMLEPELMATAIQADLAQVGLDVSITTLEWNTYLSQVNSGLGDDVHLAAMAWMTNDPDTLPHLALASNAHPPKGFNSGWYRNTAVDGLITEARSTSDVQRRGELYRQLDRLVHEDAPWLFVANWRQNVVTHARVSGVKLEPTFLLDLREAGR